MNPRTRFAILALIPLGCATGENTELGDIGLGSGGTTSAMAGSGGSEVSSSGSGTTAGTTSTAGTGVAGTGFDTGGTFASAGTSTAGTSTGGSASGGKGGSASGAGGTSTAGTSSSGTAGKSSGGAAGTATGGTPASGGTGPATAYCDTHAKSALPYTVNEGFQPSGWQGDTTAVSAKPTTATAFLPNALESIGEHMMTMIKTIFSRMLITLLATSATFEFARLARSA